MTNSVPDASLLLRRALKINGCFSTLSGIAILSAHHNLVSLLGLPERANLYGLGAALLLFAASLFWIASRDTIRLAIASVIILLDLAWVAGSVPVMLSGWLSTPGIWIVGVVADIVLFLAALQFYGLLRFRAKPMADGRG